MYTETVSDAIWKLLPLINNGVSEIAKCYLGGGTSLALQLGHRKSEDLDFFTEKNIGDVFQSFKGLKLNSPILITNQSSRHIELAIDSIKIDIIKAQIPLKFTLNAIEPNMENIFTADPKDIGRMKIHAIGSRGCKKDFIDLYCITREIISIRDLIDLAMEENHNIRYSKLLFLKGLVDFEDADKEPNPFMIWNVEWDEVKDTLVDEIMKIADKFQET